MKWFKHLALSLALLFIYTQQSHACGGFFCSNVPMNQAAERILFVKRDDGKITTHVQIQYSGAKTDFAWILPMPSVPELGVSHNSIFQQLQFATQPTFQLEWEETDCPLFFPPTFVSADGSGPRIGAAESGVEVIAEQRVGPYDTAIITSDDPAAMIDWLVSNGYQLGNLGADLQPIAMTYDADMPGIPIKLTAIAAEDNMGVLVWVLGQNRAIPENYLHVEINEASIDWLTGGGNYDQVVTDAANEAGGQAFATEYAGQSTIMQDRIYRQGQYDNLELLSSRTDPVSFLEGLLILGFPGDAQMQSLIRRNIPIPQRVWDEGVLQVIYRGNVDDCERARADTVSFNANVERWFYNNTQSFSEYITDINFDPAAFVRDIQTVIVDPLKNAQELFGQHPYLTRLYTTLSADEMTVDPMFAFNADLPDLSNTHQAKAKYICPQGPDTKPEDHEVLITLSDGRELLVKPQFFGFPGPGPLPRPEFVDAAFSPLAASRIERMALTGAPALIRGLTLATPDFDNSGSVDFDDFLAFGVAFGKREPAFHDFLNFVQAFQASE